MSKDFLDSVLILSNTALSYNNQLSDAYMVRGNYYGAFNKSKQAKEEYDKAINLNPNDFQIYYALGNITFESDYIKSIEYYQKAASLERGELLPKILRSIGWVFAEAGFTEKAKSYLQEAFDIDHDSLLLNNNLSRIEDVLGNYSKESEYDEVKYSIDSTNTAVLWCLGYDFMFQRKHEKAFIYFKKWIEKQNNLNSGKMLFTLHRVAWAYWQNGHQKEAEFYLNTEIKNSQHVNKLDRDLKYPMRSDYDLAAAYAFKGEKEIALKNLRIYSQAPQILLGMLNMIKNDPLFDNIRNETEFQTILKDLEAKYQAKHERVRKWLEEQGKLKLL
jgi:lipopolysaccharide biosynthesis regulator YciM